MRIRLSRIFQWPPGWKKLGFKGRVEVWGADGKFKSAHKTIQDALDSIPNKEVKDDGKQ